MTSTVETTSRFYVEDKSKAEKMSPQKVRDILQMDNQEIVKLCKQVNVTPKKDPKGRLYFSKDDVNVLKGTGMSYQKALVQEIATQPLEKRVVVDVPLKNVKPASLDELLIALAQLEGKLEQRISSVLDEKLDGMDDVVMELINAKVEIDKLRNKLAKSEAENYEIKSKLNSFKTLGFGMYYKSESPSELD